MCHFGTVVVVVRGSTLQFPFSGHRFFCNRELVGNEKATHIEFFIVGGEN